MNFCSQCGSSQVVLQVPEGDNRLRFCCTDCGTIHYHNPRMVVGCLVTRENEIMLCRRAIAPGKGLWNLPAGYLENGETVEAGALRETWEEAGARAEIQRMLCLYNLPQVNQVYLFFLAKITDLQEIELPESEEVTFFLPEHIPYSDMAFSSSVFAIECYLQDLQTGNKCPHLGVWGK